MIDREAAKRAAGSVIGLWIVTLAVGVLISPALFLVTLLERPMPGLATLIVSLSVAVFVSDYRAVKRRSDAKEPTNARR